MNSIGGHEVGVVDDGHEHFAGPGFAQDEAKAALLGVDSEEAEDFLLVREQRERFGVEGMALETKVRADHKP